MSLQLAHNQIDVSIFDRPTTSAVIVIIIIIIISGCWVNLCVRDASKDDTRGADQLERINGAPSHPLTVHRETAWHRWQLPLPHGARAALAPVPLAVAGHTAIKFSDRQEL